MVIRVEKMSNLAWLICRDPVHIGGADSSSRGNNNPIYRLPDRTPVIPGSSLRGALREHSQQEYSEYVHSWFGSESGDDAMKPGSIGLGWGFPLWFPIHVLGYGTWWVTCPQWIQRYRQLNHELDSDLDFDDKQEVYTTNQELDGKTVYLRWLKLDQIKSCTEKQLKQLPYPSKEINLERCFVVPSSRINLLVEMSLIRQPRVKLKSFEDFEQVIEIDKEQTLEEQTLVENLFSVEGLPPGSIFFFAWVTRQLKEQENPPSSLKTWKKFLFSDRYLGGLWGIGYGRVSILPLDS